MLLRPRAFQHCDCLAKSQLFKASLRYYVRAVDWSNPAGGKSPKKKRWIPECSETEKCSNKTSSSTSQSSASAPKFGIVAAMAKNRVIGVDGRLPWNLPEDRRHFENLTRDKVLIIGRHTFGEQDDGSHIAHVRECIVVSTTADDSAQRENERIRIACSFDVALNLASELAATKDDDNDDTIDCWVGGGQRIYEEALKHPCAQSVHLTEVEVDIEFSSSAADVALFPRKYTWDRHFTLLDRKEGRDSGRDGAPEYAFTTYKRRPFN